MSKRLVTDPDEIFALISTDSALAEAVSRDEQGVYILGSDGNEKRYITRLVVEDD